MKFLRKTIPFLFIALLAVGCGEGPRSGFQGNHTGLDGNVECTENADCADNEVCTADGECKTKGVFDCRVSGGDSACGAGYTCNNANGQCNAVSVCTPVCTARECGNDGCGGTCGTCGVEEECSATGLCVPDGDSKHCGTTGCPSGHTCNAVTGACEYTTAPTGNCRVFASGASFTLYAAGVPSIAAAEGGWSAPIKSTNGDAYFSDGGHSYVSFNAQRADGLWAFGWDGISPSNVTKVVGYWHLDCGGAVKKVNWPEGFSQPNCGATLKVGEGCRWSTEVGKYRLVARIK